MVWDCSFVQVGLAYITANSYLGVMPLSTTWGPAGFGMVSPQLIWKHSGPWLSLLRDMRAWIQVFSDWSTTNAVTSGGAGILVCVPEGQKATASMAIRKQCSDYCAETEALMQAASIVQVSDHDCKQIVFLSNALSTVQTYPNQKHPDLAKAIQEVAAIRRAVLQWIPAHCGI